MIYKIVFATLNLIQLAIQIIAYWKDKKETFKVTPIQATKIKIVQIQQKQNNSETDDEQTPRSVSSIKTDHNINKTKEKRRNQLTVIKEVQERFEKTSTIKRARQAQPSTDQTISNFQSKRDMSIDFCSRKTDKTSSVILMPTGDIVVSYKIPKKKKQINKNRNIKSKDQISHDQFPSFDEKQEQQQQKMQCQVCQPYSDQQTNIQQQEIESQKKSKKYTCDRIFRYILMTRIWSKSSQEIDRLSISLQFYCRQLLLSLIAFKTNLSIPFELGVLFVCFVVCRLIDKGIKNYFKKYKHPILFKAIYVISIIIFLIVAFLEIDEENIWFVIILFLLDATIFDIVVFLFYLCFLNDDQVRE